MNFSIDIIDIINNNSGVVTFTVKAPYRLKSFIKHVGTKQEQKVYNILELKETKETHEVTTSKIQKNTNKTNIR